MPRPDTSELIELLAELFPHCFAIFERRRRPLKLRIDMDITAAVGDLPGLNAALGVYTANGAYLKHSWAGAPRIDLTGAIAGVVTLEEAAHARERLAGLKERARRRRDQLSQNAKVEKRPQRHTLADLRRKAMEAAQ